MQQNKITRKKVFEFSRDYKRLEIKDIGRNYTEEEKHLIRSTGVVFGFLLPDNFRPGIYILNKACTEYDYFPETNPVIGTEARKITAEDLAALQEAVRQANEYMRVGGMCGALDAEYNAGYYKGLADGIAKGTDYLIMFDVENLDEPYSIEQKEPQP